MPTSITSSGITFDDATTLTTGVLTAANIASGAVTTAKIDDAAVTLAKLGTNEQKQVCKAWVNFNGTGTVAIRAEYNVSSITDNGVGQYTVNFTTAFADANYAVVGTSKNNATSNSYIAFVDYTVGATASAVKIITSAPTAGGDSEMVSVAVFR
jgi:hypothetical protein